MPSIREFINNRNLFVKFWRQEDQARPGHWQILWQRKADPPSGGLCWCLVGSDLSKAIPLLRTLSPHNPSLPEGVISWCDHDGNQVSTWETEARHRGPWHLLRSHGTRKVENHVSGSSNKHRAWTALVSGCSYSGKSFLAHIAVHPGCDAIVSLGIKKFTREKKFHQRETGKGKIERKFHYVSRHYETDKRLKWMRPSFSIYKSRKVVRP